MKRSFSPHANSSGEQPPKSRKLSGLFSAIKGVFSRSAPTEPRQLGRQAPDKDAEDFSQDAFPASFVVNKRKSVAAAGVPHGRSSIPRSSISMPSSNGNALYSAAAAAAADSYSHGHDSEMLSAVAFESRSKEVSPSVFIPKNQILPTNPAEMELADDNQPIVIEHEFAGTYRDERGELVRPPFINLDPRERYHMLQLKKSVEASEFLQSRLKYMVDPDETTSVQRPGNKVDTCTQTHNSDFLEKSLHFTALRKKLALTNRKQRATRRLGLFLGEFYYEPENKPTAASDSKFSGYLGDVAKPQFTKKRPSQDEPTLPDDDARSLGMRNATARPGLDDKLRYEKNIDSPKISDVIKLKPSAEPKKPTVGPSNAFNFEINKEKLASLVSPEKTEKPVSSENPVPAETVTFGGSSSESAKRGRDDSEEPKPAFSFGVPAEPKKTSFSFSQPQPSKSAEPPKSLFSKPESAEKEAPKFSSGDKEQTPKFSFGNSAETPKLFGKDEPKPSLEKSAKPTPAFSFGSAAKPVTPAFSFGADKAKEAKTPTEKPAFSFGQPEAKAVDKAPAFSFGTKTESAAKPKPAFNFSANVTKEAPLENKTSTPERASDGFKLDAKRPAEDSAPEAKKPAFGFGAKETPKFSFGASSAEKPAENAEKPALFGSTPALSFGKPEEKKDAPFSFGKPEAAKPAFSFGQKDPSSKESTPSFGAKPAFSFGSTTQGAAPAFGANAPNPATPAFGTPATPAVPGGAAPAQPAGTPAFSFGQTATADPAAIFGGGATPNASTPAPSFNFSAGAIKKDVTPQADAAPKPSGFSFSSRAIGGLGGSRPATPGFGFGAAPSSQPAPAPAPVPAFGGASATAPSSVFGGDASRSVTPSNFAFGQPPQLNAGAADGAAAQPNGFGAPAGFSFGNNTMGAFNSAPGSFGQASREQTPPAFGGAAPAFGGNPNTSFTPPIANVSGRRIAQMRQRKRF